MEQDTARAEALVVHRYQASLFPLNAYLIESPSSVVIVDATLGVSDGRTLRARADAIGKPVRGVVVTHAHPDHYGGLSTLLEGLDVPVLATAGVADAIRRDDDDKERILRPMFGDEWPRERSFPDTIVHDGEAVTLGDIRLTVTDLGPGESPHDSLWSLDAGARPSVFCGDLVYNRMHAYLADGFHAEWLRNIERTRRALEPDTLLYPGHGDPGAAGPLLDAQAAYIEAFVRAVHDADSVSDDEAATALVTTAMRRVLPADDLIFLMQLSVGPVRQKAG